MKLNSTSKSSHRFLSGLLSTCILTMTFPMSSALATPTAEEIVRSEALFQEAKRLMNEQKYAEACPKFEESLRLEEGVGTILNLATCYAKSGKTASAWAQFELARTLAQKARDRDRVRYATEQIKILERKLSKLTVDVDKEADIAGLEIKLDNSLFGRASWSTAFPIDPGEHQLTAIAPGKIKWTTQFTINPESDQKSIKIPVLESEPVPVQPPPTPAQPPPMPKPIPPPSVTQPLPVIHPKPTIVHIPTEPNPWSTPGRIASYIVGGVGLAALGVGIGLGSRVVPLRNEANSLNETNSSEAHRKVDQAKGFLVGSQISIGVGLVSIGVATVLFFTSGSSSPTLTSSEKPKVERSQAQWYGSPYASNDGAGLVFGGRF